MCVSFIPSLRSSILLRVEVTFKFNSLSQKKKKKPKEYSLSRSSDHWKKQNDENEFIQERGERIQMRDKSHGGEGEGRLLPQNSILVAKIGEKPFILSTSLR